MSGSATLCTSARATDQDQDRDQDRAQAPAGPTWRLHHSLHVLLLQLLDALRLDLAVLLQAAHLVHILVVEELEVRGVVVQFSDMGLEL